jgi:hypothetical protein
VNRIRTDRQLEDEELKGILQRAFAPHRSIVAFQHDAFSGDTKLALVIQVSGISPRICEFLVEGVPIESLRRRETLSSYIDDVREHMRERAISFHDRAGDQEAYRGRDSLARRE